MLFRSQIERPMLVDAITTSLAPTLGTTTAGAFLESATGIEAGGRTGFTVFVTGTCFLFTLFFAPFVGAIPPQAYGPALILVGLFMLSPVTQIALPSKIYGLILVPEAVLACDKELFP